MLCGQLQRLVCCVNLLHDCLWHTPSAWVTCVCMQQCEFWMHAVSHLHSWAFKLQWLNRGRPWPGVCPKKPTHTLSWLLWAHNRPRTSKNIEDWRWLSKEFILSNLVGPFTNICMTYTWTLTKKEVNAWKRAFPGSRVQSLTYVHWFYRCRDSQQL